MLIALKRLKLRTSNFTCTFSGIVRTCPLKFFSKMGVARITWPPKFWSRELTTPMHLVHWTATKWSWSALVTKFEISHFTSLNIFFAIFNDRPFRFYTQLKREEYKRFIYTTAHKWAWLRNVTKFVVLHPLNYFCNVVDGRVFKFYT